MQTIINFLSTAYTRIRSNSPAFFVGLRKFCLWVTGVSALLTSKVQAIIVGITTYGLDVPGWLQQASGYIVIAGLVASAVTTLTVDPAGMSVREYKEINPPADA